MSLPDADRKVSKQETEAEYQARLEAHYAKDAADLKAHEKARFVRSRVRLIGRDYRHFAYGALDDLRLAMHGRLLSTEEALPLLRLWAALARAAWELEVLAREFCDLWCSDPDSTWTAFDAPDGLAYVQATPMHPSRATLRAAFGLDALPGPWKVLVSEREHETRRKAAQRSKAPIPAPCKDERPRGSKPWDQVGVSRKTWYAWSTDRRTAAAKAAGVELPWLDPVPYPSAGAEYVPIAAPRAKPRRSFWEP